MYCKKWKLITETIRNGPQEHPYFVRLFHTSRPLRSVELRMKKESRDLVASTGHLCGWWQKLTTWRGREGAYSTVKKWSNTSTIKQPLTAFVGLLVNRVISRIYLLGKKSQVAEGHELPRGIWGHAPSPPINFFKWICTEMQSGAFWDTILRNVPVCALTLSRLNDFSDIVTYTL